MNDTVRIHSHEPNVKIDDEINSNSNGNSNSNIDYFHSSKNYRHVRVKDILQTTDNGALEMDSLAPLHISPVSSPLNFINHISPNMETTDITLGFGATLEELSLNILNPNPNPNPAHYNKSRKKKNKKDIKDMTYPVGFPMFSNYTTTRSTLENVQLSHGINVTKSHTHRNNNNDAITDNTNTKDVDDIIVLGDGEEKAIHMPSMGKTVSQPQPQPQQPSLPKPSHAMSPNAIQRPRLAAITSNTTTGETVISPTKISPKSNINYGNSDVSGKNPLKGWAIAGTRMEVHHTPNAMHEHDDVTSTLISADNKYTTFLANISPHDTTWRVINEKSHK